MSDLLLMYPDSRRYANYEIRSRGFTLIEILLAVAIIGIIVAVVYGSLWTVTQTVDDARERMELSQTARGVLWKITNEISNAFSGEEMYFTGVKSKPGSVDENRLSFNSTVEGFGQEQKDIREIEYYLSRGVLYQEIDGVIFPVVENVDGFSLRYFDGVEWKESWDSKLRGKFPKMVEINLELGGKIFSTAVSIPVAGRHIR